MIWKQFLGHDAQVEMFRRAAGRGRLAHAYLLIGPRGIGKKFFARLLAQCLFCREIPDEQLEACGQCQNCVQMQAGTHPDLIQVGLPEGKRILPIELMVGDSDHRGRAGLCHDISMAPMSADRRIAIIDDADAMNPECSNSLLKTLEEPPAGSLIFLLTPEVDPILPTIRSRCQPVRFRPLSNGVLERLLQAERNSSKPVPAEILEMAEGSLETARELLDPGIEQLWKAVSGSLQSNRLNPTGAVKEISDALDGLGGDTAAQRLQMRRVVSFAVETLRRRLNTAASVEEADRVGRMMDRCFEADLHLQQTMPIPLCLEALFTELGRRSRAPS